MDRALGITSADPYRVVSEPGYESGGLRRKLLDPAVCLDGPSPVAYRRELREVTKRYELERRRI